MEKGISQENLSNEAELAKNLVGMIERGEVNCTLTTIDAIASSLESTRKKLMDFE